MPYQGEAGSSATRLGHVPTASNPKVKEAMGRWNVTPSVTPPADKVAELCCDLADLPGQVGDAGIVKHSITVDGSDEEVEATREFPTVKVGYIRIAGSLVDLEKFRHDAGDPFPNPVLLRKARESVAFDAALPGSGLAINGLTAADTWRTELTTFLTSSRFDDGSPLTLGDGLLSIHGTDGQSATSITIEVCPTCRYTTKDGTHGPISVGTQTRQCPNPACRAEVYLGDVLRLHSAFNEEGSNFQLITRAMNISERLMTACFMDHFAQNQPAMLERILFVTDGPLALHGETAPQFRFFLDHLQALTAALGTRTPPIAGPLLVGVEKSGPFLDHARAIRKLIPEGSVMMLTRAYINRMLGRPMDNAYGNDEFYGRRVFYRTRAGDVLVLTVPPTPGIKPYGSDDRAEHFASYPTLRVVCEILDGLRTRMYDDAVIPIALAHSTAALPLGVGRSVLTRLAQENIPGLMTSHQAIRKPTYFS